MTTMMDNLRPKLVSGVFIEGKQAFKCKRCKRRLKGGSAGDCVRSDKGGYEHKGQCSDYAEEKPRPLAPAKSAPKKQIRKRSAIRRDDGNAPRKRSHRAKEPFKPKTVVCAYIHCASMFTIINGHVSGKRYCSNSCRTSQGRLEWRARPGNKEREARMKRERFAARKTAHGRRGVGQSGSPTGTVVP